ncbi:MAG TPA: tripartite tricarboxylate transporter substrate binding protein [Xanthobacteraceae bacterium]|nr:tripartite tricarboxylate transporter substrate binding protein [Xanthobacteraceae bacterium]
MKSQFRLLLAIMLGFAAAAATATGAAAQAKWPTRPVKFIVTLGVGSGADIGARLFADRLSRKWGQPVIVENRPGGDALIAISAFVTAHDDHVLLFAPSGSFTAHPYAHDKLPYKPSDLVPIVRVSNTIVVVAVPTATHIDSIAQMVARARAEPGKLNWAAVTGLNDLLFSGFLAQEHIDITKVPYRNAVDAAKDLGENRVQVYLPALTIVRPEVDSGTAKLIAVTNSMRAPTEPNLPTAAEAGFPDLTLDGLVGLFGPSGMPLALRERIAADVRAAADPIIEDRLTKSGQIMNIGGPEEFAKSIDGQRAMAAGIAKRLGIPAAQ